MRTEHIEVVPHQENWHLEFERICQDLLDGLSQSDAADALVSVEHVGSTAVCGLWAKPIIDIDLVYRKRTQLPAIIKALEKQGYRDEGDLGIPDREAFTYTAKPDFMIHHLYACPQDSAELSRHLTFRNYLQTHPEEVRKYSNIKREAAQLYPDDIDAYIKHKSPIIESIYSSISLDSKP